MSKLKSLLLSACIILSAAGCTSERFEPVSRICLQETNKAAVMDKTQQVLSKMHFKIGKADINSGYIRTVPLPGAQFFEFWRDDNVGIFNFAEANIHTIRRTAEFNITEQNGKICIDCRVKTQRLHLPEKQLTGSSKLPEIFSESSTTKQTLEIGRLQKEGMAWIDLGNDTRLASEILKRLKKESADNGRTSP